MGSEDNPGSLSSFLGDYQQLLLFGLPGILLLMVGLAWGLWVVDIFYTRHTLLVGSAIISVWLSIIGALALVTGTMLHSVRRLLVDVAQPRVRSSHQPLADRTGIEFIQRRPLILFGGPGTILLGAGAAWGIRVVLILRQTQQLAIGSALLCMSLSIIGSLCILAGTILHSVRGLLLDLARTRRRK